MRVLVAFASKHGSTAEIAQTIARELGTLGIDTELRDIDSSALIEDYDAAIIGSAVYMGKWMTDARRFVDDNRGVLETMPVWLFSSGPLGDDELKPADDPARIPRDLGLTEAQDHIIFAGSLDKSRLGIGERLISRAIHAPDGDFRDWEAVRAWSQKIAVSVNKRERAGG